MWSASAAEFSTYETMETRMPPLIRGVSSDTVVAVPPDPQIDAGRAELQIAQASPRREMRAAADCANGSRSRRIEFEPEASFKQRERRGARPGLRRAGDGIERRPVAVLAPEAAEQLRQPPAGPCRSRRRTGRRTTRSTGCLKP